jgi:hypothetical protein
MSTRPKCELIPGSSATGDSVLVARKVSGAGPLPGALDATLDEIATGTPPGEGNFPAPDGDELGDVDGDGVVDVVVVGHTWPGELLDILGREPRLIWLRGLTPVFVSFVLRPSSAS